MFARNFILAVSVSHLKSVFSLLQVFNDVSTNNTTLNSSRPGFSISDNLMFLTPERVKDRIKHMKYEGDPDLFPVCSYENKFLVIFLYRLSTAINEAVSNISSF